MATKTPKTPKTPLTKSELTRKFEILQKLFEKTKVKDIRLSIIFETETSETSSRTRYFNLKELYELLFERGDNCAKILEISVFEYKSFWIWAISSKSKEFDSLNENYKKEIKLLTKKFEKDCELIADFDFSNNLFR